MKRDEFENALVYGIPGMDKVVVKSVEYQNIRGKSYAMDVYTPVGAPTGKLPVVVFVMGYRDSAFTRLSGTPLKDFPAYRSWGRLVAASQMVGVTYQTEQVDDLEHVVEYVRKHSRALEVNPEKMGIWACSSNAPTALSYMMRGMESLRFAVFYYSYMLTPDNKYRKDIRANCLERGCYEKDLPDVEMIRDDVPMLIVRAGLDSLPNLNESIDHFVSVAPKAAQIRLIDYPNGIHGFDIKRRWDTTLDARAPEIVAETIDFMRVRLVNS